MSEIKSGIAFENIDTPLGMDMTGYYGRKGPAIGAHDWLKIKCIALDDGTTKTALVFCDLLGLSGDFSKRTAESAGHITGIPAENIIIACIHTHSGPASIFLRDCGEVEGQWLEELGKKIASCIRKAVENMTPSQLIYKTGECFINRNRLTGSRFPGRRDTQVGVLEITGSPGEHFKTILVNYACHPVVLGSDNLIYAADYPFYMSEALKVSMAADAVFANGCCGDLNPIERGGYDIAERLGKQLAESVAAAVERIGPGGLTNPGMDLKICRVEIPLACSPDKEYYAKLKSGFYDSMAEEASKSGESNVFGAKVYDTYIQWADSMIKSIGDGTFSDLLSAEIKVLNLGKLFIIAIPFEVFHDIGLRIKEYFGMENTMVIGYAGGDFGYFPSLEQYDAACYETGNAHMFYGRPGPVSKGSEQIIYKALFNKIILSGR